MNWKQVLDPVLESEKMIETKNFLRTERKTKNIYPEGAEVLQAFQLCPYDKTEVVIIGQDPYCTAGTATGLAFSTMQEQRPKALQNIFLNIYKDLNIQYYHNVSFEEFFPTNNLTKWAENGFLLLNATLTVEEGKPNSHKDLGWDKVIKTAIQALNEKPKPVIFLLWGEEAKKMIEFIAVKHIVFESAHPATENFHARHFSIIRDSLPMIKGVDLFPSISLDACFDKERAKQIVKENYPIDAEKICNYIDKEMIISAPVNKEIYWKEIRKFEEQLSTMY